MSLRSLAGVIALLFVSTTAMAQSTPEAAVATCIKPLQKWIFDNSITPLETGAGEIFVWQQGHDAIIFDRQHHVYFHLGALSRSASRIGAELKDYTGSLVAGDSGAFEQEREHLFYRKFDLAFPMGASEAVVNMTLGKLEKYEPGEREFWGETFTVNYNMGSATLIGESSKKISSPEQNLELVNIIVGRLASELARNSLEVYSALIIYGGITGSALDRHRLPSSLDNTTGEQLKEQAREIQPACSALLDFMRQLTV